MAAWFRRGADETEGLPRGWRTALESALSGLDKGHPDLPGQLRDYVLTGSPQSALARVAQCSDAPGVLRVGGPWFAGGDRSDLRTLFELMHQVPAEVALRWGRVVEAVFSTNRWMISLGPVAGGHWAEALLIQQANVHIVDGDPRRNLPLPLGHETLESVLVAAGGQPAALLAAAFRESAGYNHGRTRDVIVRMPGYAEAVARHVEVLRQVAGAPGAASRQAALRMLAPLDDDTLRLFAEQIADSATSSSSQVRQAAGALASRCGSALAEPLKGLAMTGKSEQRLHAFRLLWSVTDDAETRVWAQKCAAADRAPSVQALAAEWERGPVDPDPEPKLESLVQSQPLPRIEWRVAVSADLRALLESIWDEANRAIANDNVRTARQAEEWKARHGSKPPWARPVPLLDPKGAGRVVARLERGVLPEVAQQSVQHHLAEAVARHQRSPLLSPVVLLHLFTESGWLVTHRGERLSGRTVLAMEAAHSRGTGPTLLELSAMLDEMGLGGGPLVLAAYCSAWGDVLGRDWPDADVAPFVAHHLDAVEALLTSTERDYSIDRLGAYRALATLPSLPRRIVDTLFEIALTGHKAHRRPAQDALATVADKEQRIITALSDGKSDVRTEAAQWLGRLRHEDAVPALEGAVAKEKQDIAKGAMLDALQILGQPVEKYLDRDALAAQASAAVAKGLPRELSWFPWPALPQVRWSDTGEPVPVETLQWLIAQAVKAKSPEPNAILRKYCAMLEPRDREQLGQFLLETWMAEDTRPIEPDEALAKAQQQAQWTHQSMASYPQHYEDHPLLGASVEQLTAAYLPGFSREPAGSAIAAKGVLAVAAACAGERAAAPVGRYLKEWYGMRAAQGKALIAMLAWIEHPSATQLMLSVGSRFRTKSFQDEATRQAAALAERKGWTVDELADRTIPTAGLDENGTLELSYGDRSFSAVLLPGLTLELRSPEGKKIASLPNPRQSDDQEKVRESKKALAAARKELKAVVQLQTERLYEALCTGRSWSGDDWDRYLGHHPVVRHLAQRLVWAAATGAEPPIVFRPLEDGTLTDADDTEVTLAPEARVQVAHDSNLDDETVEQWQRHLEDYEVTPLFQQFGKGTFELPEGRGADHEVTDFRGHLIEAFTLRGRATKLGYTRGSTEDGGWFYAYQKRFPTLGMSSVIQFSGNFLPEENRTVALTALSFERHGHDGTSTSTMRLDDVPPVLLSEAYNDMRLLAGEGSGHDPEWEKKVEY